MATGNPNPFSATPARTPTTTTLRPQPFNFGPATPNTAVAPVAPKPSADSFRPTASGLRRNLSSAPSFGDASFTVLVGPPDNAKRFSLHKALAVNASAFFDGAFRNEWKESSENVVHLPAHDPEHFEIFFLWLYTRRVFSYQANGFVRDGGGEEWDRLANAWALGAYLQATDFKDAIADVVVEQAGQVSASMHSLHKIIYANSVAGAPIRKLIVDVAVWRWEASTVEAQASDASSSDFYRDLSIALLKHRAASIDGRAVKASCDYHAHGEKCCYKTKQYGFS